VPDERENSDVVDCRSNIALAIFAEAGKDFRAKERLLAVDLNIYMIDCLKKEIAVDCTLDFIGIDINSFKDEEPHLL